MVVGGKIMNEWEDMNDTELMDEYVLFHDACHSEHVPYTYDKDSLNTLKKILEARGYVLYLTPIWFKD